MALVQMYDDGTNGDEVAGDSIWTCIVDVAADHTTGVLSIGMEPQMESG